MDIRFKGMIGSSLIVAMCSLGLMALPIQANAHFIEFVKGVSTNFQKIIARPDPQCGSSGCYGQYAQGGIRGSDLTVAENPDGSLTFEVLAGEFEIIDRVTGELIILSEGDVRTINSTPTIVPFTYDIIPSTNGSNDITFSAIFENLFHEDVFNVSARLTSNDPYISILDDSIFFGDIAADSLADSLDSFTIQNWTPNFISDPFFWTISYNDKSGINHVSENIPMLHHVYLESVPEPETLYIMFTGLLILAATQLKKKRIGEKLDFRK